MKTWFPNGNQKMAPDDDMLAFDQTNFAMAEKIRPDKQGRISLQEKMLRRAHLDKEVTLLGVRNHLELWDRKDWEQRCEELIDRRAEIALKARQERRNQSARDRRED